MGEVKLSVKLLSCTPNAQDIVAMGARLCYSDADIEALQTRVEARDQSKYLERLVAMGHQSVMEHAVYTFGVEGVSRSLMAQITRHRIASFSVKSQRYVGAVHEDGGVFNYVVPEGIRQLGSGAVKEFAAQMETMQRWYNGWAKLLEGEKEKSYEDARFVLPNAAETKFVVTMNARELLHFFNLRCCMRAQWEIRSLAWKMLDLVKEESPLLFKKAGPVCVREMCREGKMSCGRMMEVCKEYNERYGDGG